MDGSTQPEAEALLGRPALKALGLYTSEVLRAAESANDKGVDFSELLPQADYANGRIARIITQGSLFHEDRGIEVAPDENIYVDIGPDDSGEKEVQLKARLGDAAVADMSKEGIKNLELLLREFDDVTRIRLGADPPADVEPKRVEISQDAKPVVAKNRRYSAEQRKFIEKYVAQLESYGLVRPYKHSQWAAAPVLVPKHGLALFRLTFDLRPINAVTKKIALAMPNIEAELVDLRGATCFAHIDFVSGYWQLPLEEASQPLH